MSDKSQQQQFLEALATEYKLYGDTRTAFLGRFAPENADKANNQLRLSWQKDLVTPQQKIQDELKKIYPVLQENGCDIPTPKQGRYPKGESPWELAYQWLWEVKFPEWQQAQTDMEKPSETLNRCILGLKGNYQAAQQKLTDITQTLQKLLNDKTLSIAKVEEGSIILIVESSQTGYEQLKTLIGQEIAGFPVEYAIDEWQDICRRMVINRKPLTSNTVIGQVYGNRNLIDEDLFVDLALVKPKRSENPKHPQDIDSARGSDLFTRQEETVEKRFAYREFLDEIIGKRTEKNIAIIGEPGAGKTTLLQKLAFWLLQETDDLVIWVSLAELGSQALGEYLEQKWLKDALGLSREEIKADWEQKFKGGAVWLLLDGLDEMSQSDLQGLNFRGWVMNAPIIVTCRLNLWQANPTQLQGFQTYLTQPFQDEQMQEFIRRWFPGLVEAAEADLLAKSLWSELQESGKERIKDLCRNPLRLTLLCATWKVEDSLPETMAELYEGFVESVYGWKETAFPVTEEEKEQLNAALGELAKASLEAETGRFRLTHRLVCEYLGKPKAAGSLFPLALQLGWLNEVGVAAENPREKVYGFYHATFQEYFAALAVEDWDYFLPRNHVDCPVAGKRYRIFAPQWKQVILLWLGREDIEDEEKEGFIRALVEFEDGCGEWNFEKVDRGFYEYQAYFKAAIGISEFKKCTLADQIIKQITKLALGYFDIEKQELITFFDSSKAIKESAREILRIINRPKIIKDLTGISFYEECSIFFSELGLERYLLHTLNNLGNAYHKLAEAGLDPEENLEKAILNYKKAFSISQKFGSDKDRLLVLYATAKKYNTLAEQGINSEESAKEAITLHKEACDLCRRLGLEGYLWDNLKGLGNAHFILAKMGLDIEKNFQKSIFYYEESCDAYKNLGLENEKEILNILARIGETYLHLAEIGLDDENFKKAICYYEEACNICRKLTLDEDLFSILIKLANFYRNSSKLECNSQDNFTKIIDELIENFEQTRNKLTNYRCGLLETPNPRLSVIYESNCWIAADQLAIFAKDAPNVVNTLMSFLQNYNYWTRKQKSIFTIKIQKSENSIDELIKFFRDIANDLKIFPCKTILKINILNYENIEERINVLIDTITDVFFEDVHNDAIDLLEETITEFPLYAKNTKNKLLSILKSTDNNNICICRSVGESLGRIDQENETAIAALLNLIATTEDEVTRRQAAASLGKIGQGNPDAIAGLLEVIRNTEDEDTRRRAASSLGEIGQGNPEAIAVLVEVIRTTEDEDTRWQAAYSLGEIGQGNPDAIAGLLQIIRTTEDENTRRLAAGSLPKILTTREQYAGVVSALKDCLSDEVYQNNFDRFYQCYKLIWHCAENLSYPEFYQAWHHPPTTPHPEVTEQTPHSGEQTFASPFTCQSLQHLPIYCLNADILADETDTSEIAPTLCQLIWDEACPDEAYPQSVTTASQLRQHLKQLKLRQNLPKLAILITDCPPRDELIAFCRKLTNIVAVAFLTDDPLEAPLKGFPPNQPNLISAIETWLEEI